MRNAKSVVRSHIFACVLVDNSASLLLAASCVPQPRVLKSPLQNHCKIQYFLSVLLERLSCLSFFFTQFSIHLSQLYLGIFLSFLDLLLDTLLDAFSTSKMMPSRRQALFTDVCFLSCSFSWFWASPGGTLGGPLSRAMVGLATKKWSFLQIFRFDMGVVLFWCV